MARPFCVCCTLKTFGLSWDKSSEFLSFFLFDMFNTTPFESDDSGGEQVLQYVTSVSYETGEKQVIVSLRKEGKSEALHRHWEWT